jgi:phosphatidylethanolamine/phosphatidyl-N-methylethanolamine N-methyltransferase
VSGLPLLNMSTRKVVSIVGGAFSHVRRGGVFYQFTYGMSCPIPRPVLDRLDLRAKLVDRALLNVSPAAVYKLTRRPQMKLVTGSLAPDTSMPSPRSRCILQLTAPPRAEPITPSGSEPSPRE